MYNNSRTMYNLPAKLYRVRVPVIATYSDVEQSIFGMPVTTITPLSEDEDSSELRNDKVFGDMTNIYANLDTMIEMYSAGYPIRIINRSDSTEIFKTLENYLSGKYVDTSTSINKLNNTPDVRLDQIDRFVSEIFGYNKTTIVRSTMNAKSGFNLGFTPMGSPVSRHLDSNVTGRYDKDIYKANSPELDMSKIVRTSPLKNRRPMGITDDN